MRRLPRSASPSVGDDAGDAAARAVAAEAHEQLLDATTNFWERAWLRRSITKLSTT